MSKFHLAILPIGFKKVNKGMTVLDRLPRRLRKIAEFLKVLCSLSSVNLIIYLNNL